MLQVAYYPYASTLRVHLDLSALRLPGGLGPAEIELRDPAGRSLLRRPLEAFDAGGRADLDLELSPLLRGEYLARVSFARGSGCEIAGPERRFHHETFVWEKNALGETDAVIPPFTRLSATPRRIDAVGRRIHLAESGWWRQVESLGEELLAGPLRLELELDGERRSFVAESPVEVESAHDTRIVLRSTLRSGDLRLRIRQSVEIDGLVRIDLELDGARGARLERLDLVVPLRHRYAQLFNAVTDGARHHRIGATPSGNGVVWESTQAERHTLPVGFVPYLWLGDEERGFAFAAESTRDWLVAPGAPLQRIRRGADSTDLVVRFVTAPARLERARRIHFALQATPAKPRPADWRSWFLSCSPFPGVRRVCTLGSGMYWGSITPFGNVYPLGRDLSLFGLFSATRRSGRIPPDRGTGWLRRNAVPEARRMQSYRDSIAYSFRSLATRPRHVLAYINAQGSAATDEFRVYVDEWRHVPFGDRSGRDADKTGEVKIQSNRSYTDYVLWHLDRMLETGAFDGFFFDNGYLRASYDDVVGPAYRNDAGELVPGVGLFALRDFFRRAQNLVYERRGEWLNLVHMTTTPVSMVHTWAGITLDGEWKYGATDYPERFPPDLLRAGSLGAQTGTVPVYLHGLEGASGKRRDDLERQLAGLMAVHEIRVLKRIDGPLEKVWSELFDFGYGRSRCEVRRYWDAEAGFEVRGVEARVLLVVCGRDALAVVASVGEAGSAELRLDTDALGLGRVVRCKDPELRGRVRRLESEGCAFSLERYDMRLIKIRGAGA